MTELERLKADMEVTVWALLASAIVGVLGVTLLAVNLDRIVHHLQPNPTQTKEQDA